MREGDAHVVKLGGSLLDLPDLPRRFEAYRAADLPERALLVVGGGAAADIVRRVDALHGLGEERGHWLAVRAMQLNAHLLAAVLPRVRLVDEAEACSAAWARGELAMMDPLPWLEAEERAGITIPHHWQFTSDSIAAHVACRLGAKRLTLLKSTLPERDSLTVSEAVRLELVDEAFAQAARGIESVELVNLRSASQPRCVLRVPA